MSSLKPQVSSLDALQFVVSGFQVQKETPDRFRDRAF